MFYTSFYSKLLANLSFNMILLVILGFFGSKDGPNPLQMHMPIENGSSKQGAFQ